MKKLFFITTLLVATFVQKGISQNSTQYPLTQLLAQYYGIKDALVIGNSNQASMKAEEFIKTANSIDYKQISEGNINALLKDATPISETKDIKTQREHFANLSNNMKALGKTVKFSSPPVYQLYCPMKKANWLSDNKEIKNPYFGSSMLTGGKVVATINK
ncbi:hypothetical protein A3860_34235 [Niastella vici]|uniref:DUF3347 domain-containing protein n=1 Tax=Niastella vici TaxID=1703345 RepID=A0A1V9FPF7_9BACT|nr:DUF3347 domain-containing protein [Niastella vici]OQP60141.1 hypothetical protein A3860_34235 [Niastella vici]